MYKEKKNSYKTSFILVLITTLTTIYSLNQEFKGILGGVFEIIFLLILIYITSFIHLFWKKNFKQKLITSYLDLLSIIPLQIIVIFKNILKTEIRFLNILLSFSILYLFSAIILASLNYLIHQSLLKLKSIKI